MRRSGNSATWMRGTQRDNCETLFICASEKMKTGKAGEMVDFEKVEIAVARISLAAERMGL